MSATFASATGAVSLGTARNHKHVVADGVSGVITQHQVPGLAASQISNVLGVNSIPVFDGSKFTAGTLTEAQLWGFYDGLALDNTISASKITSGNLPLARIQASMRSNAPTAVGQYVLAALSIGTGNSATVNGNLVSPAAIGWNTSTVSWNTRLAAAYANSLSGTYRNMGGVMARATAQHSGVDMHEILSLYQRTV